MATTWVLHTETKGTGAQMVPLDQVTKRPSSSEPVFVQRKTAKDSVRPAAQPRTARRFKITDVLTREVLADNVGVRAALDVLREVRSTVDVNVYLWNVVRDEWRLLNLDEQRTMLELAREPAGQA
jgi:hypothetical protein